MYNSNVEILKNIDYWTIFGFSAQFIFLMRFGMQWLHSERQKKSVIPMSFWYLSIVGAIMILIYAIKRGDPVFIVGQFFALSIYIRNVILQKKSNL